MKDELEKRLEETMNEKNKLELNIQEKINELQVFKSESEKKQVDHMSTNHVVVPFKIMK